MKTAALKARFEASTDSDLTRLIVEGLPADAVGRTATLSLQLHVNTKRSRGIDQTRTIQAQEMRVTGTRLEMLLNEPLGRLYSHTGSSIDIDLRVHVEIDDGFIFDTKLHTEVERHLQRSPSPKEDAAKLIEPPDAYDFRANLAAIPPHNRMIVMILGAVGAVLIGINSLIGVHDEFAPDSSAYFYDHVGDDGSESPAMKSLMGSGGLGLAVWLAMRRQLRRYMKFELGPRRGFPRRGERWPTRDLVRGSARVPLEKTRLRVVAVNDEKGQYEEGQGTRKRTVSFTTPFRGVVVYDQYLPFIPANVPVETYLEGDIDFEEMFEVLYPPLTASSTHGIDLRWEIQLIHPQFVDQEIACSCDGLVFEDFLPRSR